MFVSTGSGNKMSPWHFLLSMCLLCCGVVCAKLASELILMKTCSIKCEKKPKWSLVVFPYQPCHVGGMGLDVVHVICRDSCERLHGGASNLPQCHCERHHPPHTLLYLPPLQSCRERRMKKWWVWVPPTGNNNNCLQLRQLVLFVFLPETFSTSSREEKWNRAEAARTPLENSKHRTSSIHRSNN